MYPRKPAIKRKALRIAVMAFGLCSLANAAKLPYATDFSGVPDVYEVGRSIVGQQGWSVYAGVDADSMVIKNPTTGGIDQVLSMARGGGVRNYFENTLPGDADIVVSYKTYAAEGSNGRDRMGWLFVVDNTSKQIAGVAIDARGRFVLNDTHQVEGIIPETGVWYTVKLTIRRVDQMLDLEITDGASIGSVTGIPYQFPSLKNQLGMIGFLSGVYNADAVVYIGDVSVTPDSESAPLSVIKAENVKPIAWSAGE